MAQQGKRSRVRTAGFGERSTEYRVPSTDHRVPTTDYAPSLISISLPNYFSSHLPCCALIVLRTYPDVPLFFYALTLLYPYFSTHLRLSAPLLHVISVPPLTLAG